jgi:hypothetical protein
MGAWPRRWMSPPQGRRAGGGGRRLACAQRRRGGGGGGCGGGGRRTFFQTGGKAPTVGKRRPLQALPRVPRTLATKQAEGKATPSVRRALQRLSGRRRRRTPDGARGGARRLGGARQLSAWAPQAAVLGFADGQLPPPLAGAARGGALRRRLAQGVTRDAAPGRCHQGASGWAGSCPRRSCRHAPAVQPRWAAGKTSPSHVRLPHVGARPTRGGDGRDGHPPSLYPVSAGRGAVNRSC